VTPGRFDSDLEYCLEHDLLDDRLGCLVRRNICCNVVSDLELLEVTRRAASHRRAERFRASPPFKSWSVKGGVLLGRGVDGEPVSCPLSMRGANALIVSGSGGGKTSFACHSALQIIPRVTGGWVFDCSKREFTRLQRPLAAQGVELQLISARALRFNLIQVPSGVRAESWCSIASQMLIDSFALPRRAGSVLGVALRESFRGRAPGHDPTLSDLIENVRVRRDAHPQARRAVIDAIEPVVASLGDALCCAKGWNTNELAQMAIAFDLSGLTDAEQDLILLGLLSAEYSRRIAEGISNCPLSLWVSIDEGARLCQQRAGVAESAIARLFRLGRGVGISTEVGIQEATNLDPAIHANANLTVLGRTALYSDITKIGRSQGLSQEQLVFARDQLQPGMFIARFLDGAHRSPFVVESPMPDLGRVVDPGESIPARLAGLSYVARRASTRPVPTDEAQIRVLRIVHDNPMKRTSWYPSQVGMGARRFQHVRDGLIERGLLVAHMVRVNVRGAASMLLSVTEEGWSILNDVAP